MKRLFYFFICILFVQQNSFAQNASQLRQPLDGKLLLSANYGELRSMHFHGGVDLKVGGKPGAKVYAIGDGYIYRLLVSPRGYGNCVYLKLDNGNFVIYGHLHKFNASIAKFIKQQQYKRESFEIDTTFDSNILKVKKGDLLGFAGNSGSSFGAHLHFEMRDSNNVPFSPMPIFYKAADNIAPTAKALHLFTLDNFGESKMWRQTSRIDLKNARGTINIPNVVEVEMPAFFGIEAIDNVNDTQNKLGVRKMRVTVDGDTIFSLHLDSIGYDKNRYINTLQAYDLLISEKQNVIKTFVENGNFLDKYDVLKNNGVVDFNDNKIHKVAMHLIDDYNNITTIKFDIKMRSKSLQNIEIPKTSQFISQQNGGFILRDSAVINIPSQALYSNTYIDVAKDSARNNFSAAYNINFNNAALHKSASIVFNAAVPQNLRTKVMLACERNGKIGAANASCDSSFVSGNISSSGIYYVMVDTVAPRIRPKFKNGANLAKASNIKIIIGDDFAGIKSYNGYIDDKWALFEYDAKNDALTYTFDATKISKGKKHKLRVVVSDWKDNERILNTTFTW